MAVVEGGITPALAIRSSVGVEIWASAGPRTSFEHKSHLPREETKNSRSISFSPDGRYFAYSNGTEIKVLLVPQQDSNGGGNDSDWRLQCTLPRPKAFYLKFSPRGNYLCTWEHYAITKDKPEGAPNMYVYTLSASEDGVACGREVFAIVQKNQADWEPSWSSDESIFAMIVGGEALFYDLTQGTEQGFKNTTRKIGGSRGAILSLGPGNCPPFLAFYTPGAKGAPSMCKLYKYPALGQNQTVACKSFFQADRVEMLWNKRGTGLLLLTSTEVDKTGASYYGNQALHFMATKGDSCSVPLGKDGPVHCVKWSPKSNEFVVVYGYMPSKAALYNLRCDVVFDFGEGPRNCAYFNPFGNLIVLAGFGNLPGNVEIWDVGKKEKLANIKCPDTTHFEWCPNGEYFVTATTAPRLRIGNGFKVYHYSGALIHETIWPSGQELLAVEWQQFPGDKFTEPVITKAKHEGIKSSQPEASKKAYTPPHLRMMKEGKNPEGLIPQPKPLIPGLSSTASTTNAGNTPSPAKRGGGGNGGAGQANKQQQNSNNRGGTNGGGGAGGGQNSNSGKGAGGGRGKQYTRPNKIGANFDPSTVVDPQQLQQLQAAIAAAQNQALAVGTVGGDGLAGVEQQLHQLQLQANAAAGGGQKPQQQQRQINNNNNRKQQFNNNGGHNSNNSPRHQPRQNYQQKAQQPDQSAMVRGMAMENGQGLMAAPGAEPAQQQALLGALANFGCPMGAGGYTAIDGVVAVGGGGGGGLDPNATVFTPSPYRHGQQQSQNVGGGTGRNQRRSAGNGANGGGGGAEGVSNGAAAGGGTNPKDSEKDKKIRNLAKKLSDIKKLKARQSQGLALELNQLNKIAQESKYLAELKALKLSAAAAD